MNENEVADLFMNALMISIVQLIMIYLVAYYEMFNENFAIYPANDYYIIIPRFLSSLMMHLNVEPDARSGIALMKYAVNHPHRFRDADKGKSRVIAAFFLGFLQSLTAFSVEIIVIIYLSSLSKLIDIIMKFITMAAICKFDDMYAGAMIDNKIKAANGYKAETEFKRRMMFTKESPVFDGEGNQVSEDGETVRVDGLPVKKNPREGSLTLWVMRVI